MVEVFERHGVSFVSVTQQFNTTTSMGRLMLNVLLSFAQFEREITGERIRDKVAASKKKGMWMGGHIPLGYDAQDRTLVINEREAEVVRTLYRLYLEHTCVRRVQAEAAAQGLMSRQRVLASGRVVGGIPFGRGHLYRILNNPLYIGRIPHKGQSYEGGHPAIGRGRGQPWHVEIQRLESGDDVDPSVLRSCPVALRGRGRAEPATRVIRDGGARPQR